MYPLGSRLRPTGTGIRRTAPYPGCLPMKRCNAVEFHLETKLPHTAKKPRALGAPGRRQRSLQGNKHATPRFLASRAQSAPSQP